MRSALKSVYWSVRIVAVVGLISVSTALPAHADSSTLALKNFREILTSLSAVTGVSAASQDIVSYYSGVEAQLPRYGTLSEFNAQSYLAMAGLGSVFCLHVISADVATGTPTSGPNLGINFKNGPASVTAAQRAKLVTNYVSEFLQRAPTATEQSALVNLFAAQTDASNLAAETQNAVLAVCSSVAGSFEFLSN